MKDKTKEQLIRELTELRREYAEIQESKQQLQAVLDYTPNVEHWVGPDGKLIWVSSLVSEVTGYSVEECFQMKDFPLPMIHEADRKRRKHLFPGAGQESRGHHSDFRIICKDGREKWVSLSWRTMYDKNGINLGWRYGISDITDKKQLANELNKTNHILGLAQEASEAGIWTMDIQTGNVTWSNALYRLFGLSPSKDKASRETWRQLFHPEDRERTERIFNDSLNRKISRRTTYRIVLSSGEIRWILSRGNTVFDEAGKPLFMVGICIDITEQKKLEEELKKHRNSLEMLVKNRTSELERKTLQLEETITTMRFLLDQRQKDKQEIQENIMANVNQLIVPFIDKLKINCSDRTNASYLDLLENNLQNIVSPFSNRLAYKNLNFTPSELQVSNLIREGKSTKEIADILNLSISTIQFHRDNIRKKLDLNKKNQKLSIFLRSLS